MDKHASGIMVLEDLLIAGSLAVLAVLCVSLVGWRDLLPGEIDLYRMMGRKSAPIAVAFQLATVLGVPVGLLCGLLLARRTFLHAAIPAAALSAFFGYAARERDALILVIAMLVVAAGVFAGAAVGHALRRRGGRPLRGPRRPMSRTRWRARALADLVLFLFVVANLVIAGGALGGSELARKYATEHPVFLLLPLAASALARYALRDRLDPVTARNDG